MHVLLIKYVQLICISVVFNTVNCEELLIEDEAMDELELNKVAACTSKCLRDDIEHQNLTSCYTNCSDKKISLFSPRYKNLEVSFDLFCRDDVSLMFNVTIDNNRKKKFNIDYPIYLIKLEKLGERKIYISDRSKITTKELSSNTSYNISITVVNSRNEFVNTNFSKEFTTLKPDFLPGNVTDISVVKYDSVLNDGHLDMFVTWTPAEDKTCFYEIFYYPNQNSHEAHEPLIMNLTKPEDLYNFPVRHISFGQTYVVNIRGKNRLDNLLESPVLNYEITTPTCIDYFNSLDICGPEIPSNVSSNAEILSKNHYNISITWGRPTLQPDYYYIEIFDRNQNTENSSLKDFSQNVTGENIETSFTDIEIVGMYYDAIVGAYYKEKMVSKTFFFEIDRSLLETEFWSTSHYIIIGVSISVIIFLIIVLIYTSYKITIKIRRDRHMIDTNFNTIYKTKNISDLNINDFDCSYFINDVMEIERNKIRVLSDILGEGAFGLVKKGLLLIDDDSSKEINVAVKMLKDKPSSDDFKEFRREIETMKAVGIHPNIVGIVGHCTKTPSEIMLLTEYCSKGNLLDYLRLEWKQLTSDYRNETDYMTPPPVIAQKLPENIFNYDISLIDKKQSNYKNLNETNSNKPTTKVLINPTNFIVNKLYDEFDSLPATAQTDVEMTSAQANKNLCTSSCKCSVEVITDKTLNNLKSNARRCVINVKDCDCPRLTECDNSTNSYGNVIPDEKENDEQFLTARHLLEFSKQIAMGMEFLSKNKIVHRDLAARNVLVCADNTVKIADFGLSRDVYEKNLYTKTGNGKLPIKWLALESMTHFVYTTQSDVWSYGILLYEIVTFGGSPYPSIETNNLLKLLSEGYRMEQPQNCSKEIYELMRSCWNFKPNTRPTFKDITEKIDDFLMEDSTENLINTRNLIIERSKSVITSTESYLKPDNF